MEFKTIEDIIRWTGTHSREVLSSAEEGNVLAIRVVLMYSLMTGAIQAKATEAEVSFAGALCAKFIEDYEEDTKGEAHE